LALSETRIDGPEAPPYTGQEVAVDRMLAGIRHSPLIIMDAKYPVG